MLDDFALIDQALADVFGLTDTDQELLRDFRAEITVSELDSGATLIKQGDLSDALFILLRGRLIVSVEKDGVPSFIGEIRQGETIGEVGLVMQARRNASVRASRSSTIARIGADSFHRLLGQYPQLGLAIARTLITRAQRSAGPRNPGFVPETLCLFKVTPDVDLDAVARAIADNHPDPVAIINEAEDAEAGRAQLHDASRSHGLAILLCSGEKAGWRNMAVAEADEIVRVADAAADPTPAVWEATLDRPEEAVLPRQTLLLVHADDTISPSGTAQWLDPRRIDRHLHMRLGNPEDIGRVTRILTGRAIGLVLAGGGARGAAHLGAIRALDEAGIVPDIVGGTSVGAAMAAWYAMGLRGDALQAAACKVFVDSGGPTNDWNLLPMVSLVKGKKTRVLAQRAIREATGTDIGIEDTWTPFFCVAANYTTQSQTVLRKGPLWRALTATYAIPGVLPPVIIDGHLHVDGGVVNNLPVDVLEETGAAKTICVDLIGGMYRPVGIEKLPTNMALLLDRLRPKRKRKFRIPGTVSILLNSTVLSSLERQRKMRERADLGLRPELERIGLLDWTKFPTAIEQSYVSVSKQIATLTPADLAQLQTVRR
jgi:NTE family protein